MTTRQFGASLAVLLLNLLAAFVVGWRFGTEYQKRQPIPTEEVRYDPETRCFVPAEGGAK